VRRLDQDAGPRRRRDECDGPSRFFYCAEASRRERDAGCDHLPASELDLFPNAGNKRGGRPRPVRNPHPTVKPIEVMRWLVRLATPPGSLVLDPFCGSGTTGIAAVLEQRRFLGIELDADDVHIARARLDHWATNDGHGPATIGDASRPDPRCQAPGRWRAAGATYVRTAATIAPAPRPSEPESA
jgi:hypothetical protein